MAYTTGTITGRYLTTDGEPAEGTIEVIPNSRQIVDPAGEVILSGRVKVALVDGEFTVALPATDDATLEPATDRQYTVVAKLRHTHLPAVTGIELPAGTTVDVASVASQPSVDAATTNAATTAQLAALETAVAEGLAGKQDAGDYATAADLAGKADTADLDTLAADVADKADTATLDQYATRSLAITRPTAIIFGDSITAQNGPGSEALDYTTGFAINSRGYFVWANAYLGQRVDFVRNAGIGGNTTAQMLARVNADVLAYDSDWVIVCGGANDITADRTASQIQADLSAILDALKSRRVCVTTIPPSTNYNTTARKATLHEMNKWILGLPKTRTGVVAADVWRMTVNPDTGYPATGMVLDAVHPVEAGAMRMGKAVAEAIAPVTPPRPPALVTLTDPKNICGNPSFAGPGTGWATVGSGVSVAYQTAADRWQNEAVLTITGVTSSPADELIQYVENVSAGRFVVGDVIRMAARVRWSNGVAATGNQYRPTIRLMQRTSGGAFVSTNTAPGVASGETVATVGAPASGDVVLITAPVTVLAGVDRLYIGAGFNGMASGTVTVSDVSVWKNG